MFKNLLSKIKTPQKQSKPQSWKVIGKTYARPRLDLAILESLTGSSMEKALFGVTTYILQDEYTGEIEERILLGSDESVLDEVLDKAEELGSYNIDRGSNTFIITKWKAPVQNVQTYAGLPVRSPTPSPVVSANQSVNDQR